MTILTLIVYQVALYEPGDYFVKLTYNNGMENVAKWNVLEIPKKRKAKNVILMIGDGMFFNDSGKRFECSRLLTPTNRYGAYDGDRCANDWTHDYQRQVSNSNGFGHPRCFGYSNE